MLADDLTLILKKDNPFDNALKLLNNFSQCSGLKINRKNKTKITRILNT